MTGTLRLDFPPQVINGFQALSIPVTDITDISHEDFHTVLVVENKVTFHALPDHAGTLAIFGSGFRHISLNTVDWLHRKRVLYWGDLDSHGFAILDRFRRNFPHTESILMARRTPKTHEKLTMAEPAPTFANLVHLTAEESGTPELLQSNPAGARRLQQESIPPITWNPASQAAPPRASISLATAVPLVETPQA